MVQVIVTSIDTIPLIENPQNSKLIEVRELVCWRQKDMPSSPISFSLTSNIVNEGLPVIIMSL